MNLLTTIAVLIGIPVGGALLVEILTDILFPITERARIAIEKYRDNKS